jgi:hypothetical protein
MSDLFTKKKNSLYESISSVNEPTTLEDTRNSLIEQISNNRYVNVNVNDFQNIISDNGNYNIENSNTQKIILETSYINDDQKYPSIVSYIDHPNINKNMNENDIDEKDINKEFLEKIENKNPKWDVITTVYVSSISVIGLYLMFKIIQKSK